MGRPGMPLAKTAVHATQNIDLVRDRIFFPLGSVPRRRDLNTLSRALVAHSIKPAANAAVFFTVKT